MRSAIASIRVSSRDSVLELDDAHVTPADPPQQRPRLRSDPRWITFGHHFAAIAGPGPLVGPVLAAQFGYLPSTLWIIIGAVLGGCVQDFVILGYSLKRDGRSLGKMASDEIGPVGGFTALVGVLMIMVILIAVLGLVVVNAMKHSAWATSTVAATVPIAMLVGIYMTHLRPGRLVEGSALGVGLIMLAVFGGRYVEGLRFGHYFVMDAPHLAVWIIAYGFLASVLPIWLLLAPRDYLSAFIKIGTIVALAMGIVAMHPPALMPPLTQFIDGIGPVFGGKVFPFAFITVACGAISGFHSLIASGTTPKMLEHETRRADDRLRRDDDGIVRRRDGDDRGGDAAAGRLFRDQQSRPAWSAPGPPPPKISARGASRSPTRRCRSSRPPSAKPRCTRAPAARRRSRSAWRTFSRARSAAKR